MEKDLKVEIDTMVNKMCKLVSIEKRKKIFEEQNICPYYKRGAKRGKFKEFYEVDGNLFMDLWRKIYPYVYKSCSKSYKDDLEDLISQVKIHIYTRLQRYGPVYCGQTFSDRLPLMVNNILTNEYKRRQRSINILRNYYYDNEDEDIEESVYGTALEKASFNLYLSIESNLLFWCDVPNNIREPIERIIDNESYLSRIDDKNILKSVINFAKRIRVE